MVKDIIKPDIKELEKAFDGDLDLVLFFLSWVKNGRNAQKAYMEINPDVTIASAGVLGSRMLKKVRVDAVLEAYGLGPEAYYSQLAEGMKAVKSDATGQVYPDHKVRKDYHDKLGKLLGIEKNEGMSVTGEKVIAILGGVTVQNVQANNSDKENT